MYHEIHRIVNKTTDYKYCTDCGSVNWYENETCFCCNKDHFRLIGKKKLAELKEFYSENYDDLQLTVEV